MWLESWSSFFSSCWICWFNLRLALHRRSPAPRCHMPPPRHCAWPPPIPSMFAIREPTSIFPIILFLHLPPLNTLPGDFFWSVALLLINIWAKKSGLGEISSHWLLFQSLTWWVCDSHWWQDRSRCVVTHPWLTSLWHGWRAGGHEQMHDNVQQHRNAESSIQQRG